MHIVLVNPEYPSLRSAGHGGIATFTYALANALSGIGNQVTVLVKEGTISDRLNPDVTLRTFAPALRKPPISYLDRFRNGDVAWEKGFARGLLHRLKEIHSGNPVSLVEVPEYNGLAYYLKGRVPFPVVVHFHTPSATVDRFNGVVPDNTRMQWYRFEAESVRRGSAYKCTSNSLGTEASKLFGIRRDRITVIRNPMPVSLFDPIIRSNTEGRIDLLFVGRLERRKGAETLLHAVRGILDLDPRINLTFAGETELAQTANYRDAIERMITDEQRKRVWFLGPVHRESLPLLYRRSGIFLFPSLFDNAPNALFEAMAAQLPVIAADAAGVNEIIRNGENGLLFPVDDQEALLSCVKRCIDDPRIPLTFADVARHEIETTYAPQSIARQTVDFYQNIIKKCD